MENRRNQELNRNQDRNSRRQVDLVRESAQRNNIERLRIRSAYYKGGQRLQRVHNFLLQGDQHIHDANQQSSARYDRRYSTTVEYVHPRTLQIETRVHRTNPIVAPYNNAIKIDGTRHVFAGQYNMKRRPLNDADHSKEEVPEPDGYDEECIRPGTAPLWHEEILFNQYQQARTMIQQHPDDLSAFTDFNVNMYEGRNIENKHDQKLMDTFIPGREGTKTFHHTDDGYIVMAGGETTYGKFMFAARLGKIVSEITLEKNFDRDTNKTHYNTYYKFEDLHQ